MGGYMKKRNKESSILFKRSGREKIIFGIVFAFMVIYSFTMLYALFFLITNSFESRLGYLDKLSSEGNPFALPEVWHWENYAKAFGELSFTSVNTGKELGLGVMFLNSIWYIGFTVGGGILASAFMAYALSKYKFKANGFIYGVAIFSMTIPVVGNMGASFKLMSDLNIYNTPWYVILTCFSGTGFNFLILYGVFKNISWSYAEAVFVDGGGHFTVFFRIMLPQTFTPMLALAVVAAIGCWNDYMTPLLYLPDFPTVASGIYQIDLEFSRIGDIPATFAGLVISILPMLVLYAACSNIIMKNFTMGGLKG